MSAPEFIAMVYDVESANAICCFDYTVEELERRADELRGSFTVTYSSVPCWPAPRGGDSTQ